jgi:AcrR family transcriptional regulator
MVRNRVVESQVVDYALGVDPAGYAALLQEMRSRAGLTIAAVCQKLDMRPGTMYQYFYKKRGVGGTSTMRWFLRYAEACGCEVTVRFPESGRRVRVRV